MKSDPDKYTELAENIIKVARNTLIVNLRFMDSAMSRLYSKPYDGTVATDGQFVYFNPIHILKSYKQGKEIPPHIYLHMVMHCVFQHFFIDFGRMDRELWDIACDVAVEAVILDLKVGSVNLNTDHTRRAELNKLKSKCKFLTAECIYRYLLERNESEEELFHLAGKFRFDDHSLWYQLGNPAAPGDGQGEGDPEKTPQKVTVSGDMASFLQMREALKQEWQNVSESMQTDMETFSRRGQGKDSSNLMQNLAAVNREKYDYSTFLKRFAVMGEAMKINDDEFDYIFYTYGMSLYDRKMPLIEPLEYKEVKRIKEFVIAIDTSGYVQGEVVQKFLNKTYNILKTEESFFTKINLHIIQCDADIKEAVKITSQEEFDEYLKTMTLKGFGGTDFRPVFDYVDELVKAKEFTNLKGLIYFTDGYGTFPAKQPDYHTAFVYVDDAYNNYDVPVWAIKLILQSDEI